MSTKTEWVVVYTGSYLEAEIIKSHLESEGIPSFLSYESAGLVYGITVDGIGEARVLVPDNLAQEAREVLKPQQD